VNEQMKFLNQGQPQTLWGATLLLYVNAAFGLLRVFSPIGLLFVVALAAGGFGIANEKKWGFALGVAGAVLQLALFVLVLRGEVFEFPYILTLMFDGLLVALLLHPESRDYQRIWFK
jgi:hypothetical protein